MRVVNMNMRPPFRPGARNVLIPDIGRRHPLKDGTQRYRDIEFRTTSGKLCFP